MERIQLYLSRARFPYSTATESLAVRLVPLALAGSGDAHELYKARESPSSLELISILGFEFAAPTLRISEESASNMKIRDLIPRDQEIR